MSKFDRAIIDDHENRLKIVEKHLLGEWDYPPISVVPIHRSGLLQQFTNLVNRLGGK